MQSKRDALIVLASFVEFNAEKDCLNFKPGSNEEIIDKFNKSIK